MQGFAKLEIQAYIVLGRSREFYHGINFQLSYHNINKYIMIQNFIIFPSTTAYTENNNYLVDVIGTYVG